MCCTPSSTHTAKDAEPFYCAYYQYGSGGGLYYYYAPHCTPTTLTPISLSSLDSGPADNECEDNPSGNALCISDGGRYGRKDLKTQKDVKLKKKLKAPTKLDPAEAKGKRTYVGADEDKPPYVSFAATLPNLTGPQPIVAQLWRYDITSKSELSHHKPIRVQIGQEVKNKLPAGAIILRSLQFSPTNSPYVFDVTVLVNGEEVIYQVVASEDRSNE